MASKTRLKASKPNKVVKPKKNPKFTTTTSRQHRFQSFSERIASLKIDPIRRGRNQYDQEELRGDDNTYLGRSLREWKDINLSAVFVAFAKEVEPLCDSLPMVIHHEDKIMDLLVEYIQKRDALAMEPLLSLLSNFAHDLNARFEKYFERGVSAVLEVAAGHPDPAVIEWSFTCLAWLFKYLSRLLTPDLRPLYDLMAPYLGRQQQKPFIVRFSAEAFSYLVRRAAILYEREKTPLDTVILHMLKDCGSADAGAFSQFHQDGIMTILVEAMKGVQQGLHGNALSVLQSLLEQMKNLPEAQIQIASAITCGILTSLIHHSNLATFLPVVQTILKFIHSALLQHDDSPSILAWSSIVFTIVSVRKGTRIADWKGVIGVTGALMATVNRAPILDDTVATNVLGLLAVVVQTASVDAVLTTEGILDVIRHDKWSRYFLNFCDLVARLDRSRFDLFVLPHLRRFVLQHWDDDERALLSLIPRLSEGAEHSKLKCPIEMTDEILDKLQMLVSRKSPTEVTAGELAVINDALLAVRFFILPPDRAKRLTSLLHRVLETSMAEDTAKADEYAEFALGPVLQSLLNLQQDTSSVLQFWLPLCDASPRMISSQRFWSNLLKYVKLCKPGNLQGEHILKLQEALIRGLSLPSHPIRRDCLELLQQLYHLQGLAIPDALSTATTIESVPVTLETARSLSMHIRSLSPVFKAIESDHLMEKLIPYYCFGLLHFNLAQAWDDAIEVIATVCQSKAGEELVVQISQSWLQSAASTDDEEHLSPKFLDVNSDGFKVLSEYECPNLAKLTAIRDQVFEVDSSNESLLAEKFRSEHSRVPVISPNARSQALKVFSKLPHVAEKRSRLLVPILLNWANIQASDESSPLRWSRKDQKAMLAVFAQFVNPKVLFKSSDVYEALLALCMNGDAEIQRSAFKTILAWKEPAITRYEEHLTNLLDEARFREEISVFLRNESEEDGIRSEDMSQLMPVLLRLLYGRAISGNKEGQTSRRKALFVALSRFGQDILGNFLQIALSPFIDRRLPPGASMEETRNIDGVPYRKQVGVLNMVNDMLGSLGAELEPYQSKILECIVPCTAGASNELNREQIDRSAHDDSMLRSIRQIGTQCLVKVFASMSWSGSHQELSFILDSIIAPRLYAFQQENLQSVSGMLRLFAAWSQSSVTVHFVYEKHGNILTAVAGLLADSHAKDEVRLFVLHDILEPLLHNENLAIFAPHVSEFVDSIGSVIEQQPSKDVLDASVKALVQLAPAVQKPSEASRLARICTSLLTKPSRDVSPTTKARLIRVLLPLIERFDIVEQDQLYTALCALFSRLRENESRLLISKAIGSLVKNDSDLLAVALICEDLNAMSGRLDEPDHDRREQAFTRVYELQKTFTLPQWLPIIHNCMYYIRDGEDRVNRSSASHGLQCFIDSAALHLEDNKWRSLLDSTIFPSIERGMLESSELVRAEFLTLLGRLAERCSTWQKVSTMEGLLVGGDEEASFFSNVLHIQHHRRLRALRRLAEESHRLNSSLVTKVFLPLIEHFVFDQVEGDAGRTLSDQSVTTIGTMAKELNLFSFRATFKRYTGYLTSKEDMEKTVLRLLGALVDGLTQDRSAERPDSDSVSKRQSVIIEEMLPPLLKYLHQKDESTVDRRMPVAVTIVKLLQSLPESEFTARLPAVLTDVSHVLRSRSQEARDQTRKALTTISSLVGPSYFRFILKELRSALKRGYQLHVLSFTVHALLLDAGELQKPGYLDECLPDLMAVIMDDIFGVTGQEKDADEYRSTMREVKSSKSFDSMELLARVVPIRQLGRLIHPIRALLCEKMDMKAIKKIDDLLIRLRKGLDQNIESDSRDMLTFCWEIVQDVYTANATTQAGPVPIDERVKRYLIQPEEPKKSKNRGATTSQIFKLLSFALNLVRKVVRRHEDLQTPANMAGFLPMAGDALVQGHEEVKLAAVKLLSTIMKVPLQELESNAPVYVKEALAMVKGSTSINTDTAKAALELVTSVLREKRAVEIKEKDIAVLLKAIKADVDEPDRQTVIYKFLRAVLHRKLVITEVYEVMDEVGQVMITNPDRSIRESARSAHLQFIMDYPQSKERWSRQADFLKVNLKYEHASGRQSVMEMLHQLLAKVGDDVFQKLSSTVFVPLVLVHVGDTDQPCREMAAILVAKIFERASNEDLSSYLSLVKQWLGNDKKPTIRTAAFQCLAILPRHRTLPTQRLEEIRQQAEKAVASFTTDHTVDPQPVLRALEVIQVLLETAPAVAFSQGSAALWSSLQGMPASADAQLHETTAKLLGSFFTDFASNSSKTTTGLAAVPLKGSGGLSLTAGDMRRLCSTSLRALRVQTSNAHETLTIQCVRNLVFLGRCFAANKMLWGQKSAAVSDNDASENEDDDEDDEDDEDQDEDDKHPAGQATKQYTALAYLFNRLSAIVRQDKYTVQARAAAIQCQAALLNHVEQIPDLQVAIRPLYALTDPSIPQPPGEAHKALVSSAHEFLEQIQKKIGTEDYVAALAVARADAKARRDDRRQKRRIEAVSAPEKRALEKKRKHVAKKAKQKEKGFEARARRRGW